MIQSKLLYIQELLTEQYVGLAKRIVDAMKQKRVVKFFYSPPNDPKGGLKAYRDVEIYALGTNKWGRLVIYAWLRNNQSSTLNSGRYRDSVRWRMFRLDGISDFKYTIQNYDISDEFIRQNRPHLNKLHNRALTDITTVFDVQKK
jgi:hypothetical protein